MKRVVVLRMEKVSSMTTENNARKEVINTSFEKIRSEATAICKILDEADVGKNDPWQIKKSIISMESKTRIIRERIKEVDSLIAIKDYKQNKIPASIRIQNIGKNEPVYKVTLQELLPHRITFSKEGRKLKYDYIRDDVFSGYMAGVEDYLLKEDIHQFKDKITALFINILPDDEREYPDLDNLDQKPFIDAVVNKRMVPDDSGQWIRYIMDSVVRKEIRNAYTEVYIGHWSEIMKVINYNL